MIGIIYSIIAGALMSIQGVFNTRASQKIGLWEINVIVQATGLAATLAILAFNKSGNFFRVKEVNKLYLLGGIIGAIIIFTVMKGMSELGATYAVAVILVSQLLTAAAFDCFGLCDTKLVPFHFTKIIGLIVMIAGIIIFKLKG